MKSCKHFSFNVFIILFFLISCKNDSYIVNEYYSDGKNIKSQITYSGKIKDGIAKTFYFNGAIKEIYSYVKDSMNGDYTSFDKKGNVSSKCFYWNNHVIGPNHFYNNNRLELYNESDYSDGVYYVKKYDSTGQLIKEEGIAISPNLYSPTLSDTIKINSIIELYFFYSQPDNYQNLLEASINDIPIKVEILPSHVGLIKQNISMHGPLNIKVKGVLKRGSNIISIDSSIKKIICL